MSIAPPERKVLRVRETINMSHLRREELRDFRKSFFRAITYLTNLFALGMK